LPFFSRKRDRILFSFLSPSGFHMIHRGWAYFLFPYPLGCSAASFLPPRTDEPSLLVRHGVVLVPFPLYYKELLSFFFFFRELMNFVPFPVSSRSLLKGSRGTLSSLVFFFLVEEMDPFFPSEISRWYYFFLGCFTVVKGSLRVPFPSHFPLR